MRAASAGDSITRHIDAPVSVDIFENGAGQLDVGPRNHRTAYDISRHDGKWHAEHLEGPVVDRGHYSADTVANLARKIANGHSVTGAVSIEDERGTGRSLTQRFEHTASSTAAEKRAAAAFTLGEAPAEAPAQLSNEQIDRYVKQHRLNPEAAQRMRDSFRSAAGGPATEAATPAERAPRSSAFNPRVADGGNLPPRREGETDGMYHVRIAPSDTAAENLLKGYSISGLKAMARDAGYPTGGTKGDLIARLMMPRRRYWDSIGIGSQGKA